MKRQSSRRSYLRKLAFVLSICVVMTLTVNVFRPRSSQVGHMEDISQTVIGAAKDPIFSDSSVLQVVQTNKSANETFSRSANCSLKCNCPLQITDKRLGCKSGKLKANGYPKHVCPQNFRNLADAVYMWDAKNQNEPTFASPKFEDLIECLKPGSIIYVAARRLDDFFAKIYPLILHEFVLVTGEWDSSTPSVKHRHFVQESGKIIQWFAQNGENIGDNIRARFSQIPLGLNCNEHSRSIDGTLKELGTDTVHMTGAIIPDLSYDKEKLLLLNFDANTDKSGGRKKAWYYFCGESANVTELYAYTGCITKDHGVRQYVHSMSAIYKRNLQYRFWLSPRGNGVDCHRTWEAMYFGRIPIMLHSALDPIYSQLPVMLVESWADVTVQSLTAFWDRYTEKMRLKRYDIKKLTVEYWRSKILAVSRHAGAIDGGDSVREPRCWSI